MVMRVEHEIHFRRRGRNFGLLALLIAFVAIVFGVTVAKVETGGLSQGFDHVVRPELIPGQTGEAPR
jgi:hypothetical protein